MAVANNSMHFGISKFVSGLRLWSTDFKNYHI